MRKHLTFLAAAFCLALPGLAGAQPAAQTLPEVVVTGSANFTTEEKRASANNMIIDQRTIQGSSAQNLSELLTDLGFATEAAPTDYDENVALLRGFNTEHLNTEANGNVLILIDGRRSGVASTRQIMLDNVERVEIIRGPEMFKYAMSSPGGVINIISKRGGGGKPLSGSIKFGAGSYEAWNSGLTLNGLVNNIDYNLGYTHSATGGDYKAGNGRKVYSTSTDGRDNLFLNLGYTFNDVHRLGVDAYYYRIDQAWEPAYIDDSGVLLPPGYVDRESQIFNLNYGGSSEDKSWSWHSSAGYSKDFRSRYLANGQYNQLQNVETKQAQAGLDYKGELLDVSGGIDFVYYDVENGNLANTAVNGGSSPRHPTSSTNIFGAYLLGTVKLMDDSLNFTGGLRFERAEAEDKSVGDEIFGNPAAQDNLKYYLCGTTAITTADCRAQFPTKRSFSHLSPSLGVSYLPIDWLKLRANYTQGWRAPSGRNLFGGGQIEGYGAPGDPRLNPEKTDSYEVGFDVAVRNANFSATYFFEDIKDFSYMHYYPTSTGASAGRIIRNAEKRYQAGFEIQTSADLAGLMGYETFAVRPYVNLTHMTKMEEQLRAGSQWDWEREWWPITRMPDTTVSYGIKFSHRPSHFDANLNFTYTGIRIPGRGDARPGEANHYNNIEFGNFTVANLSLSKRLWEFDNESNLTLKFNVNNIFNEVYSYRDKVGTGTNDTYPYPGRNYYATVSYNF